MYSIIIMWDQWGSGKMKIMVLADEESKYLWDYFDKKKLEGIDLIISCGDLAPQYLSFLATFTHAPVYYVHGNHDVCYGETPPDGCICIDGQIVEYQCKVCGYGDLAAPWNTSLAERLISIPTRQWRTG